MMAGFALVVVNLADKCKRLHAVMADPNIGQIVWMHDAYAIVSALKVGQKSSDY